MPCLLSEIKFCSSIDDIQIQHLDHGTFKYYTKKENTESVYLLSKKNYCEQRGLLWNITNKRPSKLKNKLKELEDHLLQNKVISVHCEGSNLQVLLSRGIKVIINIDKVCNDITNISFDKSFVPKVQNECIYDGIIWKSQLICSMSDGHIIGHGQHWPEGWIIESGCKRKLSICGELLVVWGRTGAENPQPWSPLTKDHQRANLHLYWLGSRGPDLITYKKTDGEPLLIIVSKINTKTLIIVEQRVSQRGAVSIEVSVMVIITNTLKRTSVTAVPLQTQVSCCALSRNENNLILGCIDGSVAILDRCRGSTKITKASFIPTLVTWNYGGAVAAVSNEKGQVQYYDTALNCLKTQMFNEDSATAQLLDLSVYFNIQPTVDVINWQSENLYIFIENGPLVIITHVEKSLRFLSLIQKYLCSGKIDKAVSLLLSWNWNDQCYSALQKLVQHLMKLPLTEENSNYLQKALGSYHNPNTPLNIEIRHKFGTRVKAMTRRFFHHLVRNKMFETAFLLAVDLGHHDLFMDLHFIAVQIGETEMAAAARAQASSLLSRCSSAESDCSRSSCSQCTTESSSSYDISLQNQNEQQIPSFSKSQNMSLTNDNYLTTNFNSVTPKTYKPSVSYIPPIPNVDLPKINFTKSINTSKTTCNNSYKNNVNAPVPLIPPPLPVAPRLTPKNLNSHSTLGIPPDFNNSSRNNTFCTDTFLQCNINESHIENPFTKPTNTINPPPLPITTPLIMNPILPPLSQHNYYLCNTDSIKTNTSPISSNIFQTANNSNPLQLSVSTLNQNPLSLTSSKKPTAKVKFSDTVTAFIVPEIRRPVRPTPPPHVTDPQKELADSLPLCHPNEDYLKDFTPVQRNETAEATNQPKIKVVHFGVV